MSLLDGVVSYLVDFDRRDWETFAGALRPTSVDEIAEAMAGFVRYAIGPGRARSIARYTLFVQAIARPELAIPLARGRATIVGWGTAWLAQLGSSAPEEHCSRLVDYLDGVILHHLVFPSPTLAPRDAGIREVLASFVSPQRQP